MPAGTLHPYEMITKKVRMAVAKRRDSTIDQRFFALNDVSLVQNNCRHSHLLAKTIVIVTSLTFKE